MVLYEKDGRPTLTKNLYYQKGQGGRKLTKEFLDKMRKKIPPSFILQLKELGACRS